MLKVMTTTSLLSSDKLEQSLTINVKLKYSQSKTQRFCKK